MNWKDFLQDQFMQPYFKELAVFLTDQYKNEVVYPKREDVFSAFAYTNLTEVKVVIVGQDPYHQPNQAHGLAFSVNHGVAIPPSLKNIFKELVDDCQIATPTHGNLKKWALQGVLLLNNVLTVKQGEPNSHKNKGWEIFTGEVLKLLNNLEQPIVFILWGNHAQMRKHLLTNFNHLIIEAAHPSPLSAHQGFFKSKPFSKTNEFLIKHNQSPIDWSL